MRFLFSKQARVYPSEYIIVSSKRSPSEVLPSIHGAVFAQYRFAKSCRIAFGWHRALSIMFPSVQVAALLCAGFPLGPGGPEVN